MQGVGIARVRWIQMVVALLTAWTAAGPALAQVKDVAAYFVVVSKDKADLRSGETANYYKVLELPAGTVLSVDGEAGEWARVTYPAAATAFVQAEHVRFDAASSTATVTEPTRLRAANSLTGFKGSWKALLAAPLTAGSTLKVTEPAKDDEGRVVAYRVTAPAAARGYVRRADVRQASPAEVESARRAGHVTEAPAPGKTSEIPQPQNGPANVKDKPQPVNPTPAPAPSTAPSAAGTPTGTTPAPAPGTTPAPTNVTPPGNNTLLEPMVKPGETPPAPVPATNDGAVTPAVTPPVTPAVTEPAQATEPPAPKAPTLTELERTFDAIRRQSPDDAEYQALIAEFQKLQDTQGADSPRLRKQIQGRIDWMQMKLEIRDRQREIEDMKRKADSQGRDVTTKLADLERQRQYAIVGRLLPSNVYDGTNLPLMYRLQSVAGGSQPRTVGYIKPSPELDLPTKLNQVVGVIGEIKMDPAMSLNIITALRVDILQAADGGPVRNP